MNPVWLVFMLGLLPLTAAYEPLKHSLPTWAFVTGALVYLLLLRLFANWLGGRINRRRAARNRDKPPRKPRWRSFIIALLLLPLAAAAAWLAGFGVYLVLLPEPPARVAADDACVAVASGAHDRIIAAIERYGGRAEILVSGATVGTNRYERDDMRLRNPDWFDDHVSFGWQARNTRENGDEIRRWAAAKHCESLVLLSDDVHLPRLSLAVRRAGFDGPLNLHAVARYTDARADLADRLRLAATAWTRYVAALLIDW